MGDLLILPFKTTPKVEPPGFTITPLPVIQPVDGVTTLADVYVWFNRYLGRAPLSDADAIGYGRVGLPKASVELEIATSQEAINYAEAHGTTPPTLVGHGPMYDSTTASDIPTSAPMVAGYIDGLYAWSMADWARFPAAVKVRIAVFATTNDGDVLDVEQGDATPSQAPAWVTMRRAAGDDPTVYVNLSNVDATRAAFAAAGVRQPHYWLAHYDNDPTIPPGYVAKQYADEALIGAHYDLSSVGPGWPVAG